MNSNDTINKYYKNLDLIRLIACIAVLLYHLNILKGGYLAVCAFFVLSGYLSFISARKKEKFSLKDYYYNRLKKLYLPLIIVVFITVFITPLFSNINWLNLKVETRSVILGYNNFWQLKANLDYFTRHINSPFMHMWYIAILIQFDLIFPFIYLGLKKLEDKFNKNISCIIVIILSLISTIYFLIMSYNSNIMTTYYSTFTRIFSLLYGVLLGIISINYKPLIIKENNKLIFYSYLILLIASFIFVDSKSIIFQISMILTSIITCRLISYGTIIYEDKLSKIDKIIKSLSSISYYVYLVQYPIIFLFQNININIYLKITLIILLTISLSYLLKYCINYKKTSIFKYILSTIILIITLLGIYKYIIAKDYTKEMKALEEELASNEIELMKRQKEYQEKFKEESDAWEEKLLDLENGEEKIKEIVSNLQVVGVGDSVMLGAVNALYNTFPNGYFDAKVSRTAWVVNDILEDLKNKNMLGNPIILNLGANGDCTTSCKEEIIKTCGDRKIFWLNVTNDNDVHFNSKLNDLASKHDNIYVIDWNSISKGHSEYFVADGIHLTQIGRKAYSKAIYDSIYEVYLDEYNNEKEEIINKHEEELKSKISFYGNDTLLNAYNNIHSSFSDAKFVINKFKYEKLKEEIELEIKNNTITNKIVFIIDDTFYLNKNQYNELMKLFTSNDIYIVYIDDNYVINTDYNNVKVIDFYKEIKNHKEYLMADKIHLTNSGNEALLNILNDNIK